MPDTTRQSHSNALVTNGPFDHSVQRIFVWWPFGGWLGFHTAARLVTGHNAAAFGPCLVKAIHWALAAAPTHTASRAGQTQTLDEPQHPADLVWWPLAADRWAPAHLSASGAAQAVRTEIPAFAATTLDHVHLSKRSAEALSRRLSIPDTTRQSHPGVLVTNGPFDHNA